MGQESQADWPNAAVSFRNFSYYVYYKIIVQYTLISERFHQPMQNMAVAATAFPGCNKPLTLPERPPPWIGLKNS